MNVPLNVISTISSGFDNGEDVWYFLTIIAIPTTAMATNAYEQKRVHVLKRDVE